MMIPRRLRDAEIHNWRTMRCGGGKGNDVERQWHRQSGEDDWDDDGEDHRDDGGEDEILHQSFVENFNTL